MEKMLSLLLASLVCLPLKAEKTELPFISSSEETTCELIVSDGLAVSKKEGIVTVIRDKEGRQQFMRIKVRLKKPIECSFSEGELLALELKTEKETRLRVRFRKSDKMYIDSPIELKVNKSMDFQEVLVPLPQAKGRTCQEILLEFTPDPQVIELRKIALSSPRKVILKLVGNPTKIQNMLSLSGTAPSEDAEVTVTIRNAAGKTFARKVRSNNGAFELNWERPPISIYRWNTVKASSGEGMERESIEIPFFGYFADDDHIWLKVKGRNVVTSEKSAKGEQIFTPVGVGYARDVIIPAQDEELMKFCKARGLNTIRLCFYTRFFNNRDTEPITIEEHIRDFILPVVLAAKRNNMYVILDDHGYFTSKIDEEKARQNQDVRRWNDDGFNEWIRRWAIVADFFKDEPNVLGYELLNEPHDITPELTSHWYACCLRAIRKVDTKHIVLMGTCDWSHARALEKTWGSMASTVDAPYNNVIFTFHEYPEDNHPHDVHRFTSAFVNKHDVPVLCTEFGATHWSKGETVCRMFQSGMFTMFAKENIGWMIWAIGQLKDHPRAPYNTVDKVNVDPPVYDSVAYSDQWIPAAKIMASEFPKKK